MKKNAFNTSEDYPHMILNKLRKKLQEKRNDESRENSYRKYKSKKCRLNFSQLEKRRISKRLKRAI